MRKIFLLFIITIISCGVILATNAETKMQSIDIADKKISVSVPSSYITYKIFDKDMDNRMKSIGFIKTDLDSIMLQNSTVLYAFPSDFAFDINVVVVPATVESFSSFDKTTLRLLMDNIDESYNAEGYTITQRDIISANGLQFMKLLVKETADPGHQMLTYMTMEDSQSIIMTLSVYDTNIGYDHEAIMESIVKESVLSKDKQKMETASQAIEYETPNTSYYYYKDGGMHFLIPNGWEERPLSQERQYIKVKMAPINAKYAESIQLLYSDLWESLPTEAKKELGVKARTDLDSMLDREFISAMTDVDEKEIVMKVYGDMCFGICKVTQETLGISITSTVASTIKNGALIQFQMFDPQGEYEETLETVLKSIYFD